MKLWNEQNIKLRFIDSSLLVIVGKRSTLVFCITRECFVTVADVRILHISAVELALEYVLHHVVGVVNFLPHAQPVSFGDDTVRDGESKRRREQKKVAVEFIAGLWFRNSQEKARSSA